MVTVLDDYSRYCISYIVKNKSDAAACVLNTIQMVERQTRNTVKILRTDNGLEYMYDQRPQEPPLC